MIHETAVTTESSLFFNVSPVFESHASCTSWQMLQKGGVSIALGLIAGCGILARLGRHAAVLALKRTSYCLL